MDSEACQLNKKAMLSQGNRPIGPVGHRPSWANGPLGISSPPQHTDVLYYNIYIIFIYANVCPICVCHCQSFCSNAVDLNL